MPTGHETGSATQPSQLFTLRMWLEDLGDGQTGWRARAQHVSSGEVRYFDDWPALEDFVERLLRGEGAGMQGV